MAKIVDYDAAKDGIEVLFDPASQREMRITDEHGETVSDPTMCWPRYMDGRGAWAGGGDARSALAISRWCRSAWPLPRASRSDRCPAAGAATGPRFSSHRKSAWPARDKPQ